MECASSNIQFSSKLTSEQVLLEELLFKQYSSWNFLSRKEFTIAINKCNNSYSPRPDRISWKYLKLVIRDDECLDNIVNIANTCINLGHWPLYFKVSSSIIITKPNKVVYDFSKSFHLIILLKMLEKLIEKVISECLQYHLIANNFIHPNQLEDLKQCFTIDMSLFMTYLIQSRWVKNLQTSMLAFDIT